MDNKLIKLSKPIGNFRKQQDGSYWPLSKSTATMDMVQLYSQEYVSALLAELEAKDKRIAELEADKRQLNEIINTEANRADAAEKRLATPVRLLGEMIVHDWEHRVERQAAFEHRKIAWDARLEEDKKAILAAGFTFTVEGDE